MLLHNECTPCEADTNVFESDRPLVMMQLPLWNEKRYAPYKVAALVEVLNEQGIAPQVSLAGTGLSPESLTQPETLTSIRQYITVCHSALQLSKDPETPFKVGSRIPLSAYGMYGFALVCSPTIREYFQVAVKYHKLATPILTMSWREEKGYSRNCATSGCVILAKW